jgi:hypothetical protein
MPSRGSSSISASPSYPRLWWQTLVTGTRKQMESVVSRRIQVLIPPDSGTGRNARPGWDSGPYSFMGRVLSTDHGQAVYRRRMGMAEPVFADMKFNRKIDRLHR